MNPEDELRNALNSRADEVEPTNDAYARLAHRVTDAQRTRPPWWQTPRLLWLATAGTVATVLVVVVGAFVLADNEGDIVATPAVTPAPTPVTPGPAAAVDDAPTPTAAVEPTAPTPAVTPTAGPTPTPLATPLPGSAIDNQGEPAGIIWPRPEARPFGSWPNSPEDAAESFVVEVSGWELLVGNVTFLDPILFLADVTVEALGEDGAPFTEAMTVRVAGGFDDAGVPNWGVVWARSDLIQVRGSSFVGPADGPFEFTPEGLAHAFEGVVDVFVVKPGGELVAQGFVTGGGVELAAITGSVTVSNSSAGPGYAIFTDLGGLGIPSSMAIIPLTLPDAVATASGCSAEGLDQPDPNPDIPPAVEATRQAIAAAAIACDYAALAALTDPAGFTYSFGGGNDPAGFWEEAEAFDAEPMRFLVEILDLPHAEDGTAGTVFYTWPDVFVSAWEDVTTEQQEALRPLFDDEDFAIFSEFGGYFSYRIAINDTGEWVFFVAGD